MSSLDVVNSNPLAPEGISIAKPVKLIKATKRALPQAARFNCLKQFSRTTPKVRFKFIILTKHLDKSAGQKACRNLLR